MFQALPFPYSEKRLSFLLTVGELGNKGRSMFQQLNNIHTSKSDQENPLIITWSWNEWCYCSLNSALYHTPCWLFSPALFQKMVSKLRWHNAWTQAYLPYHTLVDSNTYSLVHGHGSPLGPTLLLRNAFQLVMKCLDPGPLHCKKKFKWPQVHGYCSFPVHWKGG